MDAKLHRCDLHHPVPVGAKVARAPCTTIDVHCHLYDPAARALVADHPGFGAFMASETEALGERSAAYNQAQISSLAPRLTQVETRLADMDAMGVDIQLVSPSPTQYYYFAEPDLAAAVCGKLNDAIADLCARHPDRFLGLGTLPLQDPPAAAAMLRRLMQRDGFRGVEISSYVQGRDIADRFFDPFWQAADELGAVVFLHPWGTSLGARLADHYLMNLIGQPLETTIALSKLILGGTFDRHPGVKLIAAHGGGYLPAYAGRTIHGAAARPDVSESRQTPDAVLKRIWYDTVVHDPDQLQWLIDKVGVDRLVLGTDYPFDMGHYDPAGLVSGLSDDDAAAILGGNMKKLLGL